MPHTTLPCTPPISLFSLLPILSGIDLALTSATCLIRISLIEQGSQLFILQRIIQMPEQINQVLRERKIKRKKVEKFRKHRILQRYRHLQQNQQPQPTASDEPNQRYLKYYQQVFQKQSTPKSRPQPSKKVPTDNSQQMQALKQKKRGLIKKMKSQKTRKGQPLMRNYIKFALTQLQLTMKQEQKSKNQNTNQEVSAGPKAIEKGIVGKFKGRPEHRKVE